MFTKLNRVLLASGLAIGTAALLSPAAFAQTAVGVINAQIGTNNAISSAKFTGNFNFPSPNVGVTNQPLGSINIKTNNANGFKLEAYSLNGAAAGDAAQLELVTGGSTYAIPYTVTLSTVSKTLVKTTPTTWLDLPLTGATSAQSLGCTTAAGCDLAIATTVTDVNVTSKPAGTYTDTITFVYTNK